MPSKVPTQNPPAISQAPIPNSANKTEEEILKETQDLKLEIERLEQERIREATKNRDDMKRMLDSMRAT